MMEYAQIWLIDLNATAQVNYRLPFFIGIYFVFLNYASKNCSMAYDFEKINGGLTSNS